MITKLTAIVCIAIFARLGGSALAQPAILAAPPVSVFSGANELTVAWTNPAPKEVNVELNGELFQESSALALARGRGIRRKLRLSPNQAGLMTTAISVLEVRAKSAFVIRWHDSSGRIFGKTEFNVYPRTILHELETIAGDGSLGLFSHEPAFGRAFKNAGIHFRELYEEEIPRFDGSLLIVAAPDHESLLKTLDLVARRGITVIVIAPPNGNETPLRPNFFGIARGSGVLTYVEDTFVENFETNPESQLRLVKICRLAAKPCAPDLPMLYTKGSK